MIPLLAAAVALFSTKPTRKFAFSWYYVVMNVGSLLAGLSLDWLREDCSTRIDPILRARHGHSRAPHAR